MMIARQRAGAKGESFGFEGLPVLPFAVVIMFCLCVPALGAPILFLLIVAFFMIIAISVRRLPELLSASLPFMLLPTFAVASALWSDVPMVSLRYGGQLMVTVLIGVVLAHVLDLRQLVLAVFVGVSLACLSGIAIGRTGASDGGAVLIGLAGSKNQISYFALFWIASALCVLATAQHHFFIRLLAALALAPAIFLLAQGDSMTAVMSAFVMVGLLAMLAVAHWVGRGGRVFVLAAAGLIALPVVVALPQIEAEAERFRFDVLGKDAGLTGRTLLWGAADSLIQQQPVIGHGYKAIWLGPEGKGLLARNAQKDGRAFHFHDTFRELQADLGLIGLLLFLGPILFALLRSIPLLLARIDPARAFAIIALLTILLRVRTELVVGPFLTETVVLYAALAALATMPFAVPVQTREHSAPRRPRLIPRPRSRPERKHA